MQRLTYINLLNEQISFMHAPYVLSRIDGLGLADVEAATLRGAYQQGDTTAGLRREPRHVTVTLHLMAANRAEMYARRMSLLGILSPDRAIGREGGERARLIYENDHGRWQTFATPEGGLEAGSRIRDVQPNMKLTFRCESPYWYSTAESEIRFSYSGDGFTLPFTLPVSFGRRDFSREAVNAGQVAAPVKVDIIGRGETPSLLNRRTGKRLKLAAALANGYTLSLDTDPARLKAVLIDADGAESSAFGVLDIESPLADFTLLPGSNDIVYEAGGSGARSEIRVRWRDAFEGV